MAEKGSVKLGNKISMEGKGREMTCTKFEDCEKAGF